MNKIINRDFEQDEYFKKWLIGLSPRTKQNYSNDLPNWLTFIDMTPTEQIKKRIHDLNSEDLSQRTFFEQKFREYKEYLESIRNPNPLKHSTVRGRLRTVASFYARNGLPLFLKRGDWESTQQQPVIQRMKLSRDDVKAMYAHGNLRDRALLLVLAQSGFSEVDVSCLRIEELKGLYENPETEHYFIEKPREKTNEIQATCFSYEAVHDLKAMLQERGNPQSGFLFVSQTKGKGEQLEVRSINEAMKALAQKTFTKEKAKEFKTKSLRRFYNSALLHAGISPQELKDLMFGHGRKGARGHYDYDDMTIKEAYQRAFEHLSINGLQTRMDTQKIMNALKTVEETNVMFHSQLSEKTKEIEQLKKSVSKIEELTEFLNKVEPKDATSFIQYRLKHKQSLEMPETVIEIPNTETFQNKLNALTQMKKENNDCKISVNELLEISQEASLEDEAEAKNGKQIKEPNGYFAVKLFDQTKDFTKEIVDESKLRKDKAKRLQE